MIFKLGTEPNQKHPEASRNLIFHVHGGAFVTQSSKSHEDYLMIWAVKLDSPILSIDYSLAPEAPFPRAIEEIFFAYCWSLNNAKLLGSTGENIVFVGDSAGGNLVTSCLIRCIEMEVPKPKGILIVYGIFNHIFKITPSRFLTMIDVFLPYASCVRLLRSYEGRYGGHVHDFRCTMIKFQLNPDQNLSKHCQLLENELEQPDMMKSYLISPQDAPEKILAQFPRTIILTSNFDPLLDDCVEFAKKLEKLDVNTSLLILKGLPHGFLQFSTVRKCGK